MNKTEKEDKTDLGNCNICIHQKVCQWKNLSTCQQYQQEIDVGAIYDKGWVNGSLAMLSNVTDLISTSEYACNALIKVLLAFTESWRNKYE